MKKTTAVLAMFILVSTLGTAFAADSTASPDRTAGLSNGITWFDLGPAASCGEIAVASAGASFEAPFNGISVSEPQRKGSESNGSCANRIPAKMLAGRTYNGITVF